MPVADFAQNVQTPFFPMVRHAMDWKPGKSATAVASTAKPADAAAATKTASTDSSDGKSFWQDVLDVVNPLQHLPIVGTVYRAITGDKIGDVEKVAGDTLYGGPLGLVSSLADVAFEKITGKDFGSTVMSMLDIGGSGDKATAVAATAMKPLPSRTTQSAMLVQTSAASTAPAQLAAKTDPAAKLPAPQIPTLTDANAQALMAAMNQNGVDSDLGMRALFAYQKSLGLSADANGASPAP